MSINASIDVASLTYQTLSKGGRVKLDKKVVQVSGVRGATGRGVQFTITNIGTGYLRYDSNSFKFTGTDAGEFKIVSGLPTNIAPGRRASFTVALKATSNASVTRVLTASLTMTQIGAPFADAAISVRGLATTGEAGDKEPSLARILELFQYDINVGDTDPNTTELTISGPTDQISAPRFTKHTGGNVTITPVAQFVTRASTFGGRIGYYEPGTPADRTELFSMSGDDAQTVNPGTSGTTAFSLNTRQFSLFAEATTFISNGLGRVVYGEDALNTWVSDPAQRNKVRVYPFKQNGVVEANAYLVAFEEYSLQNDQNDFVFIIRNVDISNSQPELGLIPLEGNNVPDRMVFNRIENVDADFGNRVKDVSKVRLVNTGNQDLVVNVALNASSSDFQLQNTPSTITLQRNATFDITVKFRSNNGDTHNGSITLTSNDRDEPVKTISLSGFWQSDSEQTAQGIQQEPTLVEVVNVLGYKTQIVKPGQILSHGGAVEAVGDEVLADSWSAADSAQPVFIQDLALFHTQGQIDQIGWYPAGHPYYGATDPRRNDATNGPNNLIFQNNLNDGQTFFPRLKDSSDQLLMGSFKPGTGAFGLRVNGELTDDELNIKKQGDLGGHHWRFWPAKDENNNLIPDTYLAVVDFQSVNFDYNDHVFLIKNIRPTDRPAAVRGLYATTSGAGNLLAWEAVPGAAGYAVYRAVKADSEYVRITADVLNTTTFNDGSAPSGGTRYYRVVALSGSGKQGIASATVGIRRP